MPIILSKYSHIFRTKRKDSEGTCWRQSERRHHKKWRNGNDEEEEWELEWEAKEGEEGSGKGQWKEDGIHSNKLIATKRTTRTTRCRTCSQLHYPRIPQYVLIRTHQHLLIDFEGGGADCCVVARCNDTLCGVMVHVVCVLCVLVGEGEGVLGGLCAGRSVVSVVFLSVACEDEEWRGKGVHQCEWD